MAITAWENGNPCCVVEKQWVKVLFTVIWKMEKTSGFEQDDSQGKASVGRS